MFSSGARNYFEFFSLLIFLDLTGNFDLKPMMKILRHKESCICRAYYGRPIDSGNPTTGSMVKIKRLVKTFIPSFFICAD